jgi:Zn-dependent peptidase ImmA (M78 family)
MQLDRMELADIGNPRKMAAGVLSMIPNIAFPIPVEEIALSLEIRQIVDFDTDSFEGALLTDEAKTNCAILVRSGTRPDRRRFTIGHELGHYLMPLHIPTAEGFRCSQADMREEESIGAYSNSAWEAEANIFSAELLMPPTHFKK